MNGRRILLLGLVGALLGSMAGTPGADAKARPRTVKGTYSGPAIGVGAADEGIAECAPNGGVGCVEFPTRKTDQTISLTIVDRSGQPVYASVTQDKSSGQVHTTTQVGDICGKTAKPLAIEGGYPVDVFVWEGPGVDPACAGVATQGAVTAKISS